jgi:ERCC4-related helicase
MVFQKAKRARWALVELLQQQHPTDKVLIFTQFADTARYLARVPED